ncbi:MAG: tRNA 2-thiocytidine(32) synthetase TtcA [Burkholderiaceae bacterium]|jgi:tRNA 2-thiocytidine biosynthesis protein TtcA|nr:tRNA 2-thiocytidine(32) synthetase TtcA [Burkholderiaceae bacterium]
MTTRRQARKAGTESNKLLKRLCRQTGQAIADFDMIHDRDKVMVCLSGGKDSYGLLDLLLTLRARAPVHFDVVAVHLDQGQPGFPEDILPDYLAHRDIPFRIVRENTYRIVKRLVPEGKTPCSLCSRLRRGILYRVADEIGASKIALGHHRDDILETFFLNLFFGARIKGMPPKLKSDNGKHIVIRPLAYVKERDLAQFASLRQFPVIPCNFCGGTPNMQRAQMKQLIHEWEKQFPGRVENIFSALSSVAPSHLMDRQLFDFGQLSRHTPSSADVEATCSPLCKGEVPISILPPKNGVISTPVSAWRAESSPE